MGKYTWIAIIIVVALLFGVVEIDPMGDGSVWFKFNNPLENERLNSAIASISTLANQGIEMLPNDT